VSSCLVSPLLVEDVFDIVVKFLLYTKVTLKKKKARRMEKGLVKT